MEVANVYPIGHIKMIKKYAIYTKILVRITVRIVVNVYLVLSVVKLSQVVYVMTNILVLNVK